MKTSVRLLHERALASVRSYLCAESDLITILQEMDWCRGYREFGAKSLFEYGVRVLGLSESVTLNLTSVARKAVEVPALKEMIAGNRITLSNARAIVPILTQENQQQWLSAAAQLSKRELERAIAQAYPERAVQERMKPVSSDRLEVRLGISTELQSKLKRVQDLLSSRKRKAVNLEETLEALVTAYLEREDPIEKAKRIVSSKDKRGKAKDLQERKPETTWPSRALNGASPSPENGEESSHQAQTGSGTQPIHVPGQVARDPRSIPAALKRQIDLRDGGQCTARILNGKRCPERRWIDYHHIVPISHGGMTSLENIVTLCRGHHQLIHTKADGTLVQALADRPRPKNASPPPSAAS